MTTHAKPPIPVLLSTESRERPALVVFCHLRWGFVFQRPQHLLTRLARQFDVVFVEEPVFDAAAPHLALSRPAEGVEVLTPHTPHAAPGFHDDQLPTIAALLEQFMKARRIRSPLAWLYTPMALPLVDALAPRALVYDCMDDLASFKFAPPALLQRERELMRRADVVLTGGPSLYEARRGTRPDAVCLPSAVDIEHFSPARLRSGSDEALAAQALHAGLHAPRLGFYGVIDERLDLQLVAGIADAHRDWEIVLVGPVVKIDPATLPQRRNIRWIGMQRYETLPYLLAQWDVALLPFALNEATRFISPTKTLEYLAAGVPVVSTPIRDVVSLYGEVVRVASGPAGFVSAIAAALDEGDQARAQRGIAARRILGESTWEVAAARALEALRPYAGLPAAPTGIRATAPRRDGTRPLGASQATQAPPRPRS